MPSFQRIIRHTKKEVWPIHRKKILIETVLEEAQILDLLDEEFKSSVFKMLKELKETRRTIH